MTSCDICFSFFIIRILAAIICSYKLNKKNIQHLLSIRCSVEIWYAPIISSCGLNNLLPISHAIRALFLCGMLKEPLLYSGRFDIPNLCFVKFQVIFKSSVCLFWRGISFSLQNDFARFWYSSIVFVMSMFKNPIKRKSGRRHKNWCMARVLSFLIRYF